MLLLSIAHYILMTYMRYVSPPPLLKLKSIELRHMSKGSRLWVRDGGRLVVQAFVLNAH